MGGAAAGAGAAAGGAQAEATETAPTITPREMSETDKAKKLQAFSALYGPVTLVKEKNWDGRELEFVKFSHKNRQVKMPIGLIYDAKEPKALEGYFVVYSTSGGGMM